MKLVSAPTDFPVDLEQAKAHLRVDHNDDDALIEALIEAATTYAEKFTGRAFIDQTWDYYLDEFPDGAIEIPKPPLIEVVGVFYQSGSEVEFAEFLVDDASEPGKVYLTSSGSWPSADTQANAVRIRFRAGYLDNDSPALPAVPAPIRAAILIYVSTLYQFRETMAPGSEVAMVPWSAEIMLRQYRVETAIA